VSATQSQVFVDDVVSQLTGAGSADGEPIDLHEQMERAAEDFDEKTASAFARDLLNSLCDDPGDVRRLEALLILGLAHPRVLDKHRISLVAEGRRLAVLLERGGDLDRSRSLLEVLAARLPEEKGVQHDLAALMRRTGKTDALIERYLRSAEEAMQSRRPLEAIPWLQEVLLHDRSRRDVARMIKDLREQASERETRSRKLVRFALFAVILSSVITVGVVREKSLYDDFASLPPAQRGDLPSTAERLSRVDGMLAAHRPWLGMFQVTNERNDLRSEVIRLESMAAKRRQKELEREQQDLLVLEAAREDGLKHARRNEFAAAQADFQRALELAPPDWEHREKVLRDLAALEAWQEGKR